VASGSYCRHGGRRRTAFEQACERARVIADAGNSGSGCPQPREAGMYNIVSDWCDESSFRAYEASERHRQHRARLHPYRTAARCPQWTCWAPYRVGWPG